MEILQNPAAYKAGKVDFRAVGQIQRASLERLRDSDLEPVCWRVWAAVVSMTATYSKLLDRTSLNSVADVAGVQRQGGRHRSAARESALAVAKALTKLAEARVIVYDPPPKKSGRPASGSWVPIVVGLDPGLVVSDTTNTGPEWWCARPRNGGVEDVERARNGGAGHHPDLEVKPLPRREPWRRQSRHVPYSDSSWDEPMAAEGL